MQPDSIREDEAEGAWLRAGAASDAARAAAGKARSAAEAVEAAVKAGEAALDAASESCSAAEGSKLSLLAATKQRPRTRHENRMLKALRPVNR